MGPSAIRLAGLHERLEHLGHHIRDRGDLHIEAPETQAESRTDAKYLPLIADVCERLCFAVSEVLAQGCFPLVLGGDHSIAIGTISGISTTLHVRAGVLEPTQPPKLGVIWFDAHGDINRPDTSPSGNIHGMPVSCLLGQGPDELRHIGYAGAKVAPETFCQIGLREIDTREKQLLRESGIHTYTMSEIDRRGIASVVEEALQIASDGTDFVHCSFDIDSVDPRYAPGTGTPKLGGLTYREAHLSLEILAESDVVGSLEMVEVNPALDIENQTGRLAVELIASALGSRIL